MIEDFSGRNLISVMEGRSEEWATTRQYGEWDETGSTKIRRKAWDSESDVMLSAPLTIPSPNRRWRGT